MNNEQIKKMTLSFQHLGLTEQDLANYLNSKLWRCFKLTPEDNEYLESDGASCPNCGHPTVEGVGRIEADGDGAYQAIECTRCKARWTDVYALIGFMPELEIGDGS